MAASGALALHALMFALAIWSVKILHPPPEPHTVTVDLLQPPELVTPRPAPRIHQRPSPHLVRQAPGPTPAPAVQSAPIPAPIRPSSSGAAGVMRPMLRSAVGCEHADFLGLSAEERRRCQEKLAEAARAAPPLAFNLDPRGAYASDPNAEPYLVRKPKNGCKVRVAGDHTPRGDGEIAGVTCGKTF